MERSTWTQGEPGQLELAHQQAADVADFLALPAGPDRARATSHRGSECPGADLVTQKQGCGWGSSMFSARRTAISGASLQAARSMKASDGRSGRRRRRGTSAGRPSAASVADLHRQVVELAGVTSVLLDHAVEVAALGRVDALDRRPCHETGRRCAGAGGASGSRSTGASGNARSRRGATLSGSCSACHPRLSRVQQRLPPRRHRRRLLPGAAHRAMMLLAQMNARRRWIS